MSFRVLGCLRTNLSSGSVAVRALLLTSTLHVFSFVATPAPGATCESLADLKLPETTIVLAKSFVAGAFTPPAGPPVSPIIVPYSSLPGFCRVTGIIKPSSDSSIQFEVWMPSADWNGKLQNPGNGDFCWYHPLPLHGGGACPRLRSRVYRHRPRRHRRKLGSWTPGKRSSTSGIAPSTIQRSGPRKYFGCSTAMVRTGSTSVVARTAVVRR